MTGLADLAHTVARTKVTIATISTPPRAGTARVTSETVDLTGLGRPWTPWFAKRSIYVVLDP